MPRPWLILYCGACQVYVNKGEPSGVRDRGCPLCGREMQGVRDRLLARNAKGAAADSSGAGGVDDSAAGGNVQQPALTKGRGGGKCENL